MKITKITIGRLYNLGNYEHVRYDLTVEINAEESAESAMLGMEKIINGLAPLKNACVSTELELTRKAEEIDEMRTMPAVDWERRYGHCKGTPSEVIARYEESLKENVERRNQAVQRAKDARRYFDDLGGTAQWKDAKLDWSDYDDDYEP